VSLAVFDFDGTLIEGDAGVHFARHMIGKGYLDAVRDGSLASRLWDLTRMNLRTLGLLWDNVRLHAGYRQGRVDRRQMVLNAYENFAGLDTEVVEAEMERFAREKLPRRLRGDIVDVLHDHVQDGDDIVVLSTGLQRLIWPMRDVLGADFETVACRLKTEDGKLTGQVEGPLTGGEKATRLVAVAGRTGHDLDEAFAYADHETDAAMLEVVGNPVAVHPTDAMRRRAREEGWPIRED
jgi:HAD superfamily hydrolase (TIGR01490 family)